MDILNELRRITREQRRATDLLKAQAEHINELLKQIAAQNAEIARLNTQPGGQWQEQTDGDNPVGTSPGVSEVR
mgnify:CR=1 FL=1